LRREGIIGKAEANAAHHEVGKKVRQTIKELGGTMPENLPTPAKSIKQVEKNKTRYLITRKPNRRKNFNKKMSLQSQILQGHFYW
jgi:DNA-damage-inducible protein D